MQAVVIGLIALIITPGYLFYFDVTPKLAVLLLGTATTLLLARGTGRRVGPISGLAALSLLSLAVSTALSSNAALSLFGTSWRRYGAMAQAAVLIFAWLAAFQNAVGARTILRGIAVAGLIGGAYGIAQYLGWDPLLPAAAYHVGEGIWTIVRPPGTLGYVSYFATWLLFVIFLSLALANLETSAIWRRAAAAASAVATAAMLLTGTRAAVLGLAAGGATWLWWAGFRLSMRQVLVGAAAMVLAGSAFYFSPLGWRMRTRARWFAEDPWGGARPLLWLDSLGMAGHRLPAGYGPEVFTAVFPRFESKELARAYPDFAHESPHNMFLDALVSQGVPGLVLLCGWCAAGFMAAWRSKNAGCAAALAAGIVSQQFTVFTIPTALMFYITIALATALAAKTLPNGSGSDRRRVFAAPICLALTYLALRYLAADHALALARRGLDSGDGAKASAEYAAYERWRLPGTAADLWYSRASMNLAQKAANPLVRLQALFQAGAAGVRATKTSEDPVNAWYSLATLYASQNDAGNTEKCLRAAIAANPNWFKPHWTLAQVLRLESRLPEAEGEAAAAVDLNGGKNAEVARTLEEIRTQRARGGAKPFHE
jgi:O-antigen ligase